ncbi:MAG: hypothetical protein QXV69_01375 [Sulfolobaceae archaeon]
MKLLLISGVECYNRLLDWINSQTRDFNYIIGLGDVECPQYINNFYGIIGEIESVFVFKWLKNNGRLLYRLNNISTDFSTEIVVTHYPPSNLGKVLRFDIGSNEVYKKMILYKPKILIHGHSENVGISEVEGTQVISIGLLRDGNYAVYENGKIFFKHVRIY